MKKVGSRKSVIVKKRLWKGTALCVIVSIIQRFIKKGGAIGIVRCKDCSLVYTNPMVKEPKKMLGDIKRVLKRSGILFIKVPNGRYNLLKLGLAKMAGKLKDYDIFDSYEHLTHFSHDTLKKMLEGCGFKIKKVYIGRPIQLPAWHKYVGHYYQYPSPWFMDWKNCLLRTIFYWVSKIEKLLRLGNIGYFAPNIVVIAEKK